MPLCDQISVLGILKIEHTDILSKVILNLYESPENSYIQINDMILVAKDKIVGKPTGSAIQSARSKSLRAYELKRDIKNKDK
ncbi:hypothetical protein PITCH_A1840002 [uncultured Desulfobacterium sp.]|uniref:Uncharacterized protein n=1 Tax=uncultured Desulfobacterium sp. TaxID=201089 RepID=A0A445MV90_9BACT|nr:hypothetical protein PITCH_A1840002 [uncultured Desulfobacterium sp.]